VTSTQYLNAIPHMFASAIGIILLVTILAKFWQGLFDARQLWVGLGVVFALATGYMGLLSVTGVLRGASATRDTTALVCRPVHMYFDCNGWPIFNETLKFLVEKTYALLHPLINVPLMVAQAVGSLYLYQRLARAVWSSVPREIFGAFLAGGVVFLTLARLPELTAMMLKVFSAIFSVRDTGGSATDALGEAHRVLGEWHSFLQNWEIVNAEKAWWDVSKYMGFGAQGYFSLIVNAPLGWLSAMSIVYLAAQQLAVAGIPMAVFMHSLQLKDEPTVVFRLTARVGVYGAIQHAMWWMISWIPAPPKFAQEMVTENTTFWNLIFGGPAMGLMAIMGLLFVVFGAVLPFLAVGMSISDIRQLSRTA
jgi:hypothetical protein